MKELTGLPPAKGAALAMDRMEEGLPKLWTVHRALQLRKERKAWFGADAGYTPLALEGKKANHAVAYLRGDAVMTIVPRLTLLRGGALGGGWRGQRLNCPRGLG